MKNCCQKNKQLPLILLSISIILLLVLSLWNLQQKKNTPIEKNNSEVITEINDKNKLTLEEQEIISGYLEKNISELSPEKEVLGGKFYITSIDFLSDQKLMIEYEDGHIALKAEIDFKYLDSENIVIENFKIINQ
ncbi:MAG TPA: hypothetical protein PK142_02435 [bacterium]|nr:hypothetical protein [bacterium]